MTIERSCETDGKWQSGTPCPYVCTTGACTGVCVPSSKQCSGTKPQTCDANGQWQGATACSGGTPVCSNGQCYSCSEEIALGGWHTCARKGDGTLWCWGANFGGQLGDGTTTDQATPVQVTSLAASVAEIAAGSWYTCARKGDGTLWCWGENFYGQLGEGTTANKTKPVQVTSLGTSVSAVAAGANHACARKGDGTLWCWGRNEFGELGDGTTTQKTLPVQVAALGSGVAGVACGWGHTCARKTDGTLWCWGGNNYGQLGDGTKTNASIPVHVTSLGTSVAEAAAGNEYTCARKTDGTLWCWGKVGASSPTSVPGQISALGTSVAGVAVGGVHACARKTDGSVWCWGENITGALGAGTGGFFFPPVQVSLGGTPVAEVGAGASHTCARRTDGSVWCWGRNDYNQAGGGPKLNFNPTPANIGLCQ